MDNLTELIWNNLRPEVDLRLAELAPKIANIENLREHVAALTAEILKLKEAKSSNIIIELRSPTKVETTEIPISHPKLIEIIEDLQLPDPLYIPGPSGCGKTMAVFQAAKALKKPIFKKVVCQTTGKHEFFGFTTPQGEYKAGIALEPYKNGGILFIDEIDNGNAATNLAQKELVDTDTCQFYGLGEIQRHPEFRLVACANTLGNGATAQYVGRNQQDAAFINMFVYIQGFDYDEVFETTIARNTYLSYGGKDDPTSIINDFHATRKAVNSLGLRQVISTRALDYSMKRFALAGDLSFKETLKIIHKTWLKNMDQESINKICKIVWPDFETRIKESRVTKITEEIPAELQEPETPKEFTKSQW